MQNKKLKKKETRNETTKIIFGQSDKFSYIADVQISYKDDNIHKQRNYTKNTYIQNKRLKKKETRKEKSKIIFGQSDKLSYRADVQIS